MSASAPPAPAAAAAPGMMPVREPDKAREEVLTDTRKSSKSSRRESSAASARGEEAAAVQQFVSPTSTEHAANDRRQSSKNSEMTPRGNVEMGPRRSSLPTTEEQPEGERPPGRRTSSGRASPRSDHWRGSNSPRQGSKSSWFRQGSKGSHASPRSESETKESRKASKESRGETKESRKASKASRQSWLSWISEDEITYRARVMYVLMHGFAHWFGAHRFDRDGDGKFDARDVQKGYNDLGRTLHISFTAPTTKATKKAQKRREKKTGVQPKAKPEPKPRDNSSALSIAEQALEEVLGGSQILGEVAEEEVIQEHLRQFYPWFSIAFSLVLLGLWLGYAVQMDLYSRTAINAEYMQEWVLETVANPTMEQQACEQECSKREACRGFAIDYSPDEECVLLTEVASTDGFCRGDRKWCGVYQFQRESKSMSDFFILKAGIDTAYPGQTGLAGRSFCQEGLEFEVWRLFSYQLTHVGLQHVAFNVMLLLAFGIPLEGAYGTVWMGILWTIGVIGGGLGWSFWDAHTPTVGASGGCYSLIGMHVADTCLNWSSKKYKWIILMVCSVVVILEAVLSYGKLGLDGFSSSSLVVHVGGCVAGLVLGFVFGLDLHPEYRRNRVCKRCTGVMGVGLVACAVVWWFAANPFPASRSIKGEEARCWLGQVCIAEGIRNDCEYTCVSCDSRECMESWYPRDESGNINKALYGTSHTSESICDGIGYTDYARAPE